MRAILIASLLLAVLSAVDALADAVPGQGTWETTLLPRDVDRDGTVDAYYDTELDITWLADGNLADTVGFNPRPYDKRRALAWLEYLNDSRWLGVTTWRFPSVTDVGNDGCTPGIDCGQYAEPDTSELMHMYSVTLGNLPNCDPGGCGDPGNGLTNAGPFENLQDFYWALSEDGDYWRYVFSIGDQTPYPRFFGDAGTWPVTNGDIGEMTPVEPEPELPGEYAALHCTASIDGDSAIHIAAVTTGSHVVVKDINGTLASRFAFTRSGERVDSDLLPDLDANQSPELAIRGERISEIRDLRTGSQYSYVNYWSLLDVIEQEPFFDVGGDGVPDLLAVEQYFSSSGAKVRDAQTGSLVAQGASSSFWVASDLEVYGDYTGDGVPEVGVIANVQGSSVAQVGRLYLYDLLGSGFSSSLLSRRAFDTDSELIAQALVADTNGNAYDDVAILRSSRSSPKTDIVVVDTTASLDTLRYIGLASAVAHDGLFAIPDQNQNGSDELVSYGAERDGVQFRVQVNDTKTGELLNSFSFGKDLEGLDASLCPDANGNAAPEVAVLARSLVDDRVYAVIKDSMTGDKLAFFRFPAL